MIIYLLIGLGGALGSVVRYWLSETVSLRLDGLFPWGTFLVNVSGCALIGLFETLPITGVRPFPVTDARAFLMIGICGGYTTFSAFSLQTVNLLRLGDWPRASAYVAGSVVLCVLGTWLGLRAGTWLFPSLRVVSNSWLFWSLLSALFAGATAVLAKVGVAGVDSNLATAIRTTVVLVFAWAIVLVTSRPFSLGALGGRTWVFLALSGIATGLSWLCYFRALQLGQASQVAPIDKLSVIFVLVFAALFLHEPLTLRTGLGAALIVAGAVVLAWKM